MSNNIDNISDADVSAAILGLPTYKQIWEMQQARRKPVFKSASLSTANQKPSSCTRCNQIGHDAVNCPFAVRNLLAPSSSFY